MTPSRGRDEHLAWAKQRALNLLDAGDMEQAFTSMASDLDKHPDLVKIGDKMFPLGMRYVMNRDVPRLRRWIEGFR